MSAGPFAATRIAIDALPVIDIAAWSGGAGDTVARTLFETCRDVGFFYVRGHDVPDALVADAFAAARAFFVETFVTEYITELNKLANLRDAAREEREEEFRSVSAGVAGPNRMGRRKAVLERELRAGKVGKVV